MLTSFQSIKSELADSFDWLTEDNLYEYVDGFVPVYTNEIIAEWTIMPNEYDNTWQELGLSDKATITDRMSADLLPRPSSSCIRRTSGRERSRATRNRLGCG
jgi:hypothetical protein